jgi:hypothetical protein
MYLQAGGSATIKKIDRDMQAKAAGTARLKAKTKSHSR